MTDLSKLDVHELSSRVAPTDGFGELAELSRRAAAGEAARQAMIALRAKTESRSFINDALWRRESPATDIETGAWTIAKAFAIEIDAELAKEKP